ncbi:hypothetical protein HOY82DRAFT_198473 [Tuber indicum]|nr:hypothetical protein HOY82DRAFT_198473 [Tuber indicum]
MSSFSFSFSSAVKAFVSSFIYHFFCEFFLSHASTIPFTLVWLTAFPFIVTSMIVPEELIARFISGLPGAVFDYLFDYLFEDFIAAYEGRIVVPPTPVPVPVPVCSPVWSHTTPLSVLIEILNPVDTPPPSHKLQAEDILPASYPAFFPSSSSPPPPLPPPAVVRPAPGHVRKVRICCLPAFEK